MNPTIPPQNCLEPAAADASGRVCWCLTIVATPEPLLLPRVLQKLAVPEIDIVAVHYDAGGLGSAQAELRFMARPERAHLVAVRLQKLIPVLRVLLRGGEHADRRMDGGNR